MKKNSDFIVSRNVPHLSALRFARRLTKAALFVTFFVTILYISKKDFSRSELSNSIVFIFMKSLEVFTIIFTFSYTIGRMLPKVKQNYLIFLKKKVGKEIEKFELNDEYIQERVDREMRNTYSTIEQFFRPIVRKFLKIKVEDKMNFKNLNQFKKAQDFLNRKLSKTNDSLLRNVGLALEEDLNRYMFDESIYIGKPFYFDLENWISKLDFRSRKRNLRKKIINESISKKVQLEKIIDEIDSLTDYKFVYK